jgi:hypothetical protein
MLNSVMMGTPYLGMGAHPPVKLRLGSYAPLQMCLLLALMYAYVILAFKALNGTIIGGLSL